MEYLRGWRALRQDPQWTSKLGVASGLVAIMIFVPGIGIAASFALVGWCALAMRRAVSGQDSPLPRLDFDFEYLKKLLAVGFKGFIARMIWTLPVMIVVVVLGFCMAAAVGASAAAMEGDEEGGLVVVGIGLAMFLLIMPLTILMSMPMQIAVLRAELTDDLNAAMRFKEVLSMTRLLAKELLIGGFVLFGVQLVVSLIGVATCYLGLLPGLAIVQLLVAYLHAELYKAYLQKGGAPLPIGPLDVDAPPPSPPAYPQPPGSF